MQHIAVLMGGWSAEREHAAMIRAPYAFSWNTATALNGMHTLLSKAFDAAGNVGVSSPITVYSRNSSPPPTDP